MLDKASPTVDLGLQIEAARQNSLRWLSAMQAAGLPRGVCRISAHHDADVWPGVLLPGMGEDGGDLSIVLPAWPEEQDLILLRQGVRADFRFWVDQRSLELVAGGEVRYTFVARSANGARSGRGC